MNKCFGKVITASAGTGKTYRLSVEYLSLLINHATNPEFFIDSILVLTFTKKATAEIRERITKHVELLLEHCLGRPSKESSEIMQSLMMLNNQSPDAVLSDNEIAILKRFKLTIADDKSKLQVMTIDSYISSIFRNLIRPIRCIDSYDIDVSAIDKRLPYLMEYVMQAEFRKRIQSLLQRRINPSLDEYKKFFASLVETRWLYYLISSRVAMPQQGSHISAFIDPSSWETRATEELKLAQEALQKIFMHIKAALGAKVETKPLSNFMSDFRKLYDTEPSSFDELESTLYAMLRDDRKGRKLFGELSKDNFWQQKVFNKNTALETRESLAINLHKAALHLANSLVYRLQMPEQAEILQVWGLLLEEYDRLIYRYRNLTYDDVSWFTFEALFSQDPPRFNPEDLEGANEFYHFLSHRSRFILIDEFQDTSLLQFSILYPIMREVISGFGSKPFGGFIVVGDEKQSIFGWRGGERDLLLNIKDIFGSYVNVQTEPLLHSYRSSPMIMKLVNDVFSDSTIHGELGKEKLSWSYPIVESAVKDEENESVIQFGILSYQQHGNNILRSKDEVYKTFIREVVQPHLFEGEKAAILCRKSDELAELKFLLEQESESALFQPTASLQKHPLVSPIIAWIKYLAYSQWLDFLAFLRSDYIMIEPKELKIAIDAIYNHEQQSMQEPDFSSLPLVNAYYQLAEQDRGKPLSNIVDHLLSMCLDVDRISQRDCLNVHAFVQVCNEYEQSVNNASSHLPAFLTYLEDNVMSENLKQRSVEDTGSLELQTIHKSKGLQYDRVFVFYNLSSRGTNQSNELRTYIRYADQSFAHPNDFALSLHYNDILKGSSFAQLVLQDAQKDELEELNILYVAFTRAKTKLHVMFTYLGSKVWDEYLDEHSKSKTRYPLLLCDAFKKYMIKSSAPTDGNFYRLGSPKISDIGDKTNSENTPQKKIEGFHQIPGWNASNPDFTPNPSATKQYNTKQNWLFKRSALKGTIVHEYLRHLRHNTAAERDLARKHILRGYGSLLKASSLLNLLQYVDEQLLKYSNVFMDAYDKIYTELTIYDGMRELRIDRLLVNSIEHKALIVDFKTGTIDDQEQLSKYKEALLNHPSFANSMWQIETMYLELDLPD